MTTTITGLGFSIELKGVRLEHRGTHKGLPLYEALGGKVTAVAIVEKPAIGVGSALDDDSRTMLGPVMIPDQKIFRRRGPQGHEDCYWYFSAVTIDELQRTFDGSLKLGHG